MQFHNLQVHDATYYHTISVSCFSGVLLAAHALQAHEVFRDAPLLLSWEALGLSLAEHGLQLAALLQHLNQAGGLGHGGGCGSGEAQVTQQCDLRARRWEGAGEHWPSGS